MRSFFFKTFRRIEHDAETDQPLAGFSLDQCIPVTGDRLQATVTWKTRATLPTAADSRMSGGRVRLHFQLTGEHEPPKFYSYWFA